METLSPKMWWGGGVSEDVAQCEVLGFNHQYCSFPGKDSKEKKDYLLQKNIIHILCKEFFPSFFIKKFGSLEKRKKDCQYKSWKNYSEWIISLKTKTEKEREIQVSRIPMNCDPGRDEWESNQADSVSVCCSSHHRGGLEQLWGQHLPASWETTDSWHSNLKETDFFVFCTGTELRILDLHSCHVRLWCGSATFTRPSLPFWPFNRWGQRGKDGLVKRGRAALQPHTAWMPLYQQ